MTTAFDYFRSVAAVLGDDEPNRPFQRYPLRDLIMAYNRGMQIVYKYRPDLFTVIKQVHLQVGSRQNARGCCDNVLRVLEQVDATGGVITPLETHKTEKPKAPSRSSWVHKPSCLIHKDTAGERVGYVIEYATLDNGMNGLFSVHPPVPCDVDAWVNVKCVQPPCDMREDLVNGELEGSGLHNTALWHYIVASMLVGDRHAVGATQEAQMHFKMFFELLGIEYKQETLSEMEGRANAVR